MENRKAHPPAIADIAAAAGVSVATVSRVINGNSHVSGEVAERVRAAIARLDYVRVRKPKAPSGLCHFAGLAIPDIENPYFASLARGAQAVASAHGLDLLLMDSTRDDEKARKKAFSLARKGMDFLLYVPSDGMRGVEGFLSGLGLPVVFMDRCPELPEANYVGSENQRGAYNATKYLLSLGHRGILYLAGSSSLNTERERRWGFDRALSEEGIDPASAESLDCDFSLSMAHDAVAAALGRKRGFTAIFAADDYMAYGALNAIRERGLRVPEDISLIGFDDIPYSCMVSLTTVSQPAFQIGSCSMLLALDLLEGRRLPPQRTILPTSLIIRGSCAIPSGLIDR
jgi:LacI family transcriptional regulator